MLNEIFGPELLHRAMCLICLALTIVFCISWGFFFVGDILGSLIGNAVYKK